MSTAPSRVMSGGLDREAGNESGDGVFGSLLAPYTVDPAAIAARVDRDAKRLTWTIDKARAVARLDQTDVQPGGIELPLRPMLGCVGVAPARKEAISTAAPGAFGGNMDYAFMGAGVKLMLPVNEPGALLFLGDGHARQGEGEGGGHRARDRRWTSSSPST
jgi:acetamidase/formamidase